MKKLLTAIFFFAFGFLGSVLIAQPAQPAALKTTEPKKYTSTTNWVSMMRNRNVNVHDVQNAFHKWYKKNHKGDEDKDRDKHKDTSGKEAEEDEAYEAFKRWEWYNLPRADINGNRMDLFKVASDYQSFLSNSPSNAPSQSLSVGTASWSYAGNTTVPSNSSTGNGGDGRVNRIRVCPGNNTIMFACAASGGLWETTNGGTSWSENTDQLGDLSTSDVAINPLKTNIMYLATGDGDGIQSIYPTPATIGVLKSYDGGNTWNATSLAYSLSTAGADYYSVNEILVDPLDTSVILAATTFGIWRSANSGVTWTQTSTATWFHSMEFEPGHPSIVYAASSNVISGVGANFYRSVNNGISWTKITSGLPTNANAEGFEIGVTAADTNDVYLLADSSGDYSFEGLYLSTNHGVSFSTQSTTPDILGWDAGGAADGGQGWYTLSMAVSQTNADSIFVGGVNVWASANGGVTWQASAIWDGTPYVHADIHHIQFIPGTNSQGYVVGCDGGVFITSNSGNSWTDLSNNLEIGQQYCIGPSASKAGSWVTGWQDNGTNFSSSPWSQVYGGDGMDCFIDWSNNRNFYAETPDGGLAKSTNAGASWTSLGSDITESGPWVTVWLQDPRTSTTLYSGFSNVWKSTNSGNSWSSISTWGGSGSITALVVDSANTNYIYAAQARKIEMTANGGTSWTSITTGLPTNSASISAIAVSSKSPSHVWVTFSGYSSGNKVFASTNSGSTWTNISSGLPNLPVNCITSESGSPNGIYVGTDQGVYYRDTTLNSWVFYNTGLPMVMVADLKIYKPGKELLAATFGRGTWETPLYASLCSTFSVTVSVTADISCIGVNNGIASVIASGGTTPYTYSWSPGGGTGSTVSGLSAIGYTVTVTDNTGCITTATATITQPGGLSATASVISEVSCNSGKNGSASANTSGGTTPYTYSWNGGGGTNSTASGLSAGTYSLTVKDNCGTSATASVTITQPNALRDSIVTASIVNETCNGGTTGSATVGVKYGTSPYTYSWSPNVSSIATASGLSAGTYLVTVSDNNGCSGTTTSITITQPNVLRDSIVTASTVNVSCYGASTGSTTAGIKYGTSPYTYSWSPNVSSIATASGLSAGTYLVTVSDNNGCSGTTTSITITQPNALRDSIVTASTVNVSCYGATTGSATTGVQYGTSPYTYSWSPDVSTSATATGLSAGTYSVTVSDSNGCSGTTTSITITQPNALRDSIVTASTVNVSCYGATTGSATTGVQYGTSPYIYSWSPNVSTIATASGLSAGTYSVTVSDSNGCSGTTTSITITQPNALRDSIVTTSTVNEACNGGTTAALTVGVKYGISPYTYLWSPAGGTNSTANGLSAVTYSVNITDNNGCTATTSIAINQPGPMVVKTDSINETSCDGEASVTVSGGTAPYTYFWAPAAQTTDTIKNQCQGTYKCTITDSNGCSQTAFVTVKSATGINEVKGERDEVKVYPNPSTGQYTITGMEKGMHIEVYDFIGRRIRTFTAGDETTQLNIADEANGVYLIRILDIEGNPVSQKKVVKMQ